MFQSDRASAGRGAGRSRMSSSSSLASFDVDETHGRTSAAVRRSLEFAGFRQGGPAGRIPLQMVCPETFPLPRGYLKIPPFRTKKNTLARVRGRTRSTGRGNILDGNQDAAVTLKGTDGIDGLLRARMLPIRDDRMDAELPHDRQDDEREHECALGMSHGTSEDCMHRSRVLPHRSSCDMRTDLRATKNRPFRRFFRAICRRSLRPWEPWRRPSRRGSCPGS